MHTSDIEFLRNGLRDLMAQPGMQKKLRPRQVDAMRAMLRADISDAQVAHSYYKLPTGFGKTVMFSYMVRSYLNAAGKSAKKIVILVPRLSLASQAHDKIMQFASVSTSEFSSRSKRTGADVIITTYLSLDKLVGRIGLDKIGVVFADEAHHVLGPKISKTLGRIISHVPVIGFTATPGYEANKTVSRMLDTQLYSLPIADAVRSGVLCPVKNILYRSSIVCNLAHVPCKSSGDYDYDNIALKIDKDKFADEIAHIYADGFDENTGVAFRNCKALINCPNTDIAERQAAKINELLGKDVAVALHSNMAADEFATQQRKFIDGFYSVACQVGTMTEGFDDPSVSVCINYPTRSMVKAEQTAGRVMRLDENRPDKIAFVIDTIFRAHPDQAPDIILDVAHNSRQALFCDVAGGVVFAPKNSRLITPKKSLSARRAKQVHFVDAQLITDTQTLLELFSSQHNAIRTIDVKSDQWLSANDLAGSYIIGNKRKILSALRKYIGTVDWIKITKSGAHKVPSLNIDYIKQFCEMAGMKCAGDDVGPKDKDWLAAHDLAKIYISTSSPVILEYMEKYKNDDRLSHAIQMRRNRSRKPLCLNIKYVDLFCKITGLPRADNKIAVKDNNWLTGYELASKYIVGNRNKILCSIKALQHKDYIQMRLNGRHKILCVNIDYIDDFCRDAGLKCKKYDFAISAVKIIASTKDDKINNSENTK